MKKKHPFQTLNSEMRENFSCFGFVIKYLIIKVIYSSEKKMFRLYLFQMKLAVFFTFNKYLFICFTNRLKSPVRFEKEPAA